MVTWPNDPIYARIIADERWTKEREAAARRRLMRLPSRSRSLPAALRRMQRILEHMYYQFSPGRFSPAADNDNVPAISDAELTRLLALLAPADETLEVERVPRSPESDEGPCLPGPCREKAS